ncbi:MAG: TonB-dependent receptor [Chitinophagaceae bacterium]|nr:MAG: TonB-dependent receptor [Chitinophagaceae bacterium]
MLVLLLLQPTKLPWYMKNILLKKAFLIFCCFTVFFGAGAQEVAVKGRLLDSATAKPVALATVNFQEPAKKISRTVVSDQNGGFQASLPSGNYAVRITHSSYRKRGKHLKVEGQPVEMGNLDLVPFVKDLAEVKVAGTRPMVQQQGDRLIYNVEDDPAAKTESASDILRRTPYVNVDGDGAVQVNGQSNFKVLLDGRETAMFSQNVKEALKAFPGATIARIEVITSPSAKYDAEGVGGIINIITKKKVAGYNGTINSNINAIGHRSAGINFNLKSGKLGLSAIYNMNTNSGFRTHMMATTTPFQPVAFTKREVGGPRVADFFFHQGNLELSYDVDSLHTVVVYGNAGRNRNEMENRNTINTWFPGGGFDSSPFFLETEMNMPTHGFGTDFIRKFKGKPQKEFSIRFNAIFNTNRMEATSQQEFGTVDRFVLNNSDASNREYTAQVDFTNPVNKTTRLETGVKMIFRKAYSDFQSQYTFDKTQPYLVDPSNSDHFSYDQNVYGGYVSVNKTIRKLTARVGLRVEHTEIDGDFASTQTSVRQTYTNLIPNLMLSNQFSKSYSANLNYTFRLGRPSINNLNPFTNNSDSLNVTFGNPDLGPQYIHSLTIQNRFFRGSKFISIQTGFNFSNNLIIQHPTFNASTGVTSVTWGNVGQLRELNLGFVSNLPVGKKWNFALNASGRFAKLRNSLQSVWHNTAAGSMNGNISYKATPLFTITSNGGYFKPLRLPNTTFPDNRFYGFNFIYRMFKQKLTATASFTNFFEKERTMTSHTENQNFITENVNTAPFRNFGLALTYSFGRLKENVSKKKGVENDDAVQ